METKKYFSNIKDKMGGIYLDFTNFIARVIYGPIMWYKEKTYKPGELTRLIEQEEIRNTLHTIEEKNIGKSESEIEQLKKTYLDEIEKVKAGKDGHEGAMEAIQKSLEVRIRLGRGNGPSG